MPLFQNATYAASVATATDPYPLSTAEVAFAGRSNAGKSSAINTLATHKRLAFVSKTPGRTQMINFFALGEGRHLVDLPGYGYANVPARLRTHWDRLLGTYLKHREPLRGIALVMDIRHAFSDLDWALIDYFRSTGKPIHVLLTKADKLSTTEARAALASARKTLAEVSPLHSAQLFSSLKRTGMEEAESVFAHWLDVAVAPVPSARKRGLDNDSRPPNKKPRAKGG